MITIFTPTYNRAYIIDNLYQSLLKQTDMDFEWLIVNDGSTDNTEIYFEEIAKKTNPFPIRYYSQKNKGKHVAINLGVEKACGDLFFIVDSDDYLTKDAIKKIKEWKSSLDNSKKWAGVAGLKGNAENQIIGKTFLGTDFIDAKNNEREKYHLLGDKAEVYFTDVLKKHPFPEFDDEKFITEEVVWNAIAIDGYYIRWFNDIIYICDYLDDGLTKNIASHLKESPKGVLYWRKIQLEAFPKNPAIRKQTFIRYYDIRKGVVSRIQIAKEMGISCISFYFYLIAIKLGFL